ncbi:hypothetical protein RUM43_011244 [Polyplax serrata]|uniref:ABC transporter domain-containing protein n=1 Tax=Polyplax serrata TaxID=468196 RepID=A0AAN8NY22_POLSC
MGPSGAGKSTLLDVLSGYRITGVDGVVLVDGAERELNSFRRMSCYIQQDDRLQSLLTTWENMKIAADLKLGVDVRPSIKEEIITKILKTIGLYEARSTRAGRLSGGQKKRLSIALELINNPLVLFLDEPTTGLDSSSCMQCVQLLKELAQQGRTIICTIHQPSASLFQLFDLVYILSRGHCLYQGATKNVIPFLEKIGMPCPKYHNPADYVIELACGEYGEDKIQKMVMATENGKNVSWYENPMEMTVPKYPGLRKDYFENSRKTKSLQETSTWNQIKVLMQRGCIKSKRDSTLTHLRIAVNIITGIMLGVLFIKSGDDASRILENYNLMFAILMHHMMSTMMLTILTFPSEINILIKEHFNRWYSLKAYYISLTLVDIPVTVVGCVLFTLIVYFMSDQPAELNRLSMFFTISLLVVLVAQGFGLMIGAVFNVVNGTFLGPTLSVPIMMFSGFGVAIKDLPNYMKWGSYVSYLRYGIEGYVGAIYGGNRSNLKCHTNYCHYSYPDKFLREVDWAGDQFWTDFGALVVTVFICRIAAFVLLKWKLIAIR